MLRGIHGFSQEEIAERVGISRQAYAKWESGATIPDVEKCARLAREYGTTVDALLRTEEMDDGRVLPPRAKGQEHMGLRVRERAWPDRHPEGGARPLRPSRGPEAHPRERRRRGVRPDPGRDLRAEDRAHEPDPVPCRRVRREGGGTPSVRGSLPPATRLRFSRLCSRCSRLSRSRRLRASPCAAGLAPHGRSPSASETWRPRRRSRAAECGKTRQAAPPRRRPRSHPPAAGSAGAPHARAEAESSTSSSSRRRASSGSK